MEAQNTPTVDASQMATLQKKVAVEGKFKNGVNWFFWIAGLSILNTLIFLLGGSITFVVGLGITQIVDGFMYGLASEIGQGGIVVRLIGFVIDIFVSGIFVLFGILGRKRFRWSIVLGAVLYALDGVILIPFKDVLGVAFHIWALSGIVGGLKWLKELQALEQPKTASAIEPLP